MKSILLIVTIILILGTADAQSYIYKNCSSSSVNCIFTVSDNYIYKGSSTSSVNCVYTCDGSYIYKGSSAISYYCLYTIQDGSIYKGSSAISSNFLYSNNGGGIYKGSDCILTISGNNVYKGGSTSSVNCIATFTGEINQSLLAILVIRYFELDNSNSATTTNNIPEKPEELGKATGTLEVGSLVAIKWYDGKYWFARILSVDGESFYVITGDGQNATISLQDMIAISDKTVYQEGDKVMATWTDMKFYMGVLGKTEKEGAYVKWDDGSEQSFVKYIMMFKL